MLFLRASDRHFGAFRIASFVIAAVFLISACDLSSPPCSTSEYFPLDINQVYEYDYRFTSGGGQASGEDRAFGTLTWTVTESSCSDGFRSLTINEKIEGVSEFRTFGGENQDWQRRDTISQSEAFYVEMSDNLSIPGYMAEPISWPPDGGEADTVTVTQAGPKESYTLVFVSGVGLVEAVHWQMHGLGGPSENTTITLVGRRD